VPANALEGTINFIPFKVESPEACTIKTELLLRAEVPPRGTKSPISIAGGETVPPPPPAGGEKVFLLFLRHAVLPIPIDSNNKSKMWTVFFMEVYISYLQKSADYQLPPMILLRDSNDIYHLYQCLKK
jgi:hypothetical protein